MDPARDPGPRDGSALATPPATETARQRRRRRRHRPPSQLKRRLRAILRPPRTLRPTRAGWVFFALILGVGLAALNTGNNLMYMVLALLLSFLVLSGVLSESALRGIRVRRHPPGELFAERTSHLAIEIRNEQKRVPAFAVVVEDLIGPSIAAAVPGGRAFALRVGPGESEIRSHAITPTQRGPLHFAGFRVATRFPFGLFSKAMIIEDPRETLVYPALDDVPALATPGRMPRQGESQGGQGGESPESAGLRAFAPGDPYRRVHWRATLRRGKLLVRDQEHERHAQHTVQLRTRGARGGEAFEADVRRAASEVVAHLCEGFRVGLRTDSTHFAPADGAAQRRALLCFLAEVEPGGEERTAGPPAERPDAPEEADAA